MYNNLNISLYLKTPEQSIILYEVENICQKRLKLYSILQETNQHYFLSSELRKHVLHKMHEENLIEFLFLLNRDVICSYISKPISEPISLQQYCELDEMSHFLFALACSNSEELKKHFLAVEIKWFQIRFHLNISKDKISQFLKKFNIVIPQAAREEILDIQNNLEYFFKDFDPSLSQVYKIPIDMAPDLLAKREVVVKDGFMYFPNNHQHIISLYIQNILKKKWRDKLNLLSTYWRKPNKDERLVEIVENIMPNIQGLFYFARTAESGLTLEKVSEHSEQLFPLCMSQLHKFLEQKSHLKHNARKQYAVFLKNAGLPYEDAIEMFKNKMTKIGEEDFIKQRYLYYFSHCYGKVGGQIDYPPQTCDEIINRTPGGSEEHGCPFAHYSEENLTNLLVDSDVEKQYIDNILDLKRKNKIKSACSMYLCNKLGSSLDVVSSPNAYYCLASESLRSIDIEDIFDTED